MENGLPLQEMAPRALGSLDIESQKLQELGQQYYRAQEYQDALRCFTKTLELGLELPISVLDNRAATHIKLNNLDAALNDGSRMIKEEKHTCTGYLRTGQILQLRNNRKMALEIYEMGMRKVPSTSPQFKKLKEVHDKLKLQLVQVNPVDILPLEIIEMIMKFLLFKEIVNLTRISKSWRTLLVTMPTLWSNLDFSRARIPPKSKAIRTYIKRAHGNVTRAASNIYGSAMDVARCITSNCPALQELRMNGGYISSSLLRNTPCSTTLKKLYISSRCRITSYTVSEICCDCPNLEVVEAHHISPTLPPYHRPFWKGLPQLHTLILKKPAGDNSDVDHMTYLVAAVPNIRELTIANWNIGYLHPLTSPNFATLRKLESLDMSGVVMPFPLELPSSIHTLNISKCQLRSRIVEWEASRLVRLEMADTTEISGELLLELLESNKGNLIYLDISASLYNQSLYQLLADSGYLEKVEELKLNNCLVDDKFAFAIAEHCSVLKKLSLANTRVSGVGVKAIVTALEGKLEYLNLDGCKDTAYDAVQWARSKGIAVAFSSQWSGKGGRKLREG